MLYVAVCFLTTLCGKVRLPVLRLRRQMKKLVSQQLVTEAGSLAASLALLTVNLDCVDYLFGILWIMFLFCRILLCITF